MATQRKKTDKIFVHCSATRASQNIGVEEIRQWHINQGWEDVGYHFIIRRDGVLEAGREESLIGSHVRYHNSTSVGVCLVGGVDDNMRPEANFTDKQMTTLRCTLEVLLDKYKGAKLMAHHDVSAKACPSFNLSLWWKTSELVTSDKG